MAIYYLYMGQGLVGDLSTCTLASGQFSNCAPIVFYNKNDNKGGLYHLGGCSKLGELDSTQLRIMCDAVKPTDTYVLCGAGDQRRPEPTEAQIEAEKELIEMGFEPTPPPKNRHDFYTVTSHVGSVTTLFPDAKTEFDGKNAYAALRVGIFDRRFSIVDGVDLADRNLKRLDADGIAAAKAGGLQFIGNTEAHHGWM